MPITSNIGGPLYLGSKLTTAPDGTLPNIGSPILVQNMLVASVVTTGTAAITSTYTVNVPASSQITQFTIDLITAWNSNTSASLKIGTASTGTDYVSAIDLKTATPGRLSLTPTTTQLQNFANVGANTAVVATVVSTGTASAGYAAIQVHYVQGS